ncbi:MAG: tRNA 2-thiouridine(34) synthase MnmA [Bacteroidales bacterium]|nr:tRNA 2-thiouridine(34) synthase MnmA [Bacteroidales bacterium]MDD4602238.1 tRNA 2-thiouridine(34) synthase MnmA [Bacteroidales bacterium]
MSATHNTVIVGLSGGVDSSVAAYLLKEQGYQVVGVTMAIWDGQYKTTGKHACYGSDEEEEIGKARIVAEKLGIPYHVFDCSAEYKQVVLDYFKSEYLAGRTPNPCVQCNQLIKFGLLPSLAKKSGIVYDAFATGHYAQVTLNAASGRFELRKAVDPKKDQTYFLYRLKQDQLKQVLFPLGSFYKTDVKELAKKVGITVEDIEESQDFYSGDYKELFKVEKQSGNIVDVKGNILGRHDGIWNYTVGQRKGLGIAWSEPLYVVGLNKEKNTVVVGIREETFRTSFIVDELNWISIGKLDHSFDGAVKIRSAQKEREAHIEPWENGKIKVTFFHPNDAITPGQSAVFYDKDLVIGGGVITKVSNCE